MHECIKLIFREKCHLKRDYVYIVGLALMLILSLSCNSIFNHYLVKNGCIVEAVITRKYSGVRNRQYSDYVYTINGANFLNTTNSSKNASVNDTIFVVVSAKSMKDHDLSV